jgi:FkbM family methyltransferase
MLINLKDAIKKHNLKIKGVIHIGAHHGQEFRDYVNNGIKDIVFIEPCSDAFHQLKLNVGNKAILFNCACGDKYDIMEMHKETANGGQSNSLLKPALHTKHYPDIVFNDTEIVEVQPLDSLPIDKKIYNMLNIDVQGAEHLVLKGAKETLKHIDIVYTEINIQELYEGCAMFDDIKEILSEFEVIETKMVKAGWGDAIFKRK